MPLQQPVKSQLIQVDHVGVSSENGTCGIGRIPVPRGIHRQHLPDALTMPLKLVNEISGSLTHGTHTIGTRQGGYMKQNTVFLICISRFYYL